jgi:pyruvate dehydrogenase E2 component (dihydrolipoamide acetyltransferase)
LVKVGDTVRKDQGLLTLESDKATMEVPSPVSGEIIEIIAKLGDELSNGDLVARIRVSAEASAAPPAVASVPVPAPAPLAASAVVTAPAVPAPSATAVLPKSPTHAIESSDLVPGAVPYASPAVRVFARVPREMCWR